MAVVILHVHKYEKNEIRKEVERNGDGLTVDTALERKELRKTMKTC